MKILIALLFAATLHAASWTVNSPVVLSRIQTKAGDRIITLVRVRFLDDSTPQRTIEKDYPLTGLNKETQLKRAIYDDQQELQAGEVIAEGAITPLAPTVTEAAILFYQEATRRLEAFNRLVTRMAWLDNTVVYGAVQVSQIRLSLRNDLDADITNAARLTVALDNTP